MQEDLTVTFPQGHLEIEERKVCLEGVVDTLASEGYQLTATVNIEEFESPSNCLDKELARIKSMLKTLHSVGLLQAKHIRIDNQAQLEVQLKDAHNYFFNTAYPNQFSSEELSCSLEELCEAFKDKIGIRSSLDSSTLCFSKGKLLLSSALSASPLPTFLSSSPKSDSN